jgi:hypothetical protein
VVLALSLIASLSVAPLTFALSVCHSCSILLQLCTRSIVSSQASSLSATPYLGTPCLCMASVLVPIARFASPSWHYPATAGRYTLVQRRWRWVHVLFTCKAVPPGFLRLILWLDLLDLLSCDTLAASQVCQALHVESFDSAAVRQFLHAMAPGSFLHPV